MSVPIRYPGDPSALKGRVHDMSKDLANPEPRDDWKPGDIAWAYHKQYARIVCGAVVDTYTICGEPQCKLLDLAVSKEDYGVDTIICSPKELFPNQESLLSAFFAGVASDNGSAAEKDAGTYFVCYEHPEHGPTYEMVSGEDAMQQRVYELETALDLDPDEDVHVFASTSEI